MSGQLKKLLIETPVDKLVILANQKRGITVSEAAKLLGSKESQIEEWVRILEEHGMLKLEFPLAGPPKIVPASFSQARLSKKVEELKQRKVEIEMLAKTYTERSKEAEKQIGLKFVPVEHQLYSKLKELEGSIKSLRILKGMEKKMESEIAEFEENKDKILKESEGLEKRTSKVTKKIDSVRTSSQDLASDIGEVLAEMKRGGKNIKILKGEQKNVEDEITALGKEIKLVSMLAGKKKQSLAGRISSLFHKKLKIKKSKIIYKPKTKHKKLKAKSVKHKKTKMKR